MAYVPYNQYDIPQDEWNRIKEEWRRLEFQYQGKERGGLPLHPNNIVMPEELKPLFKQFSYVRQGYIIPDPTFYIENTDTVTGSISFANMSGKNIEYSFDETNWTTLSASTISNVAPGNKVYLRGNNSTIGNSTQGKHISADFNHSLGGNICSLLDKTNFSTMSSITSSYALSNLFYSDTKLISADFKLGNVTSLGKNAFDHAFYRCTSLITGPDFHNITSLGNGALSFMFYGCSSLTTAPDLGNVTSLGNNPLGAAFYNCSKLKTIYTPNISTWTTSAFNNWVSGAGSSAATPKQMIFQTQTLLDACPSGNDGYGAYTKVLAA